MNQNPDPFEWSVVAERAAELLAQGELTQTDIAESVGVSRVTLYRWRNHPDFAARVEGHLAAFRDEVRRRGLAVRERRIKALNDRWTRMQRLMEARADDATRSGVPGWSTGLLTHDVKGVGKGEDFELVDLYRFDAALMRELREHEKQAAQELGQWSEKTEHSGGLTIRVEYDDGLAEAPEAAPGPADDPPGGPPV